MKPMRDKKVVMIIASQNFRDEELLEPKAIIESVGNDVTVASSSLSQSVGMLGAKVKPDITIKDINVNDYDAIIFIGGSGASEFWQDATAHKIVHDTIDKGKILGAICIAPVILAKAGVLKGKKATVWQSEKGRLTAEGSTYTGAPVEIDGKIITANGPTSARAFGNALLRALSDEE